MNEKNQKYKVASIGKQPLSDRVYEALKSAIGMVIWLQTPGWWKQILPLK